MFNNIEIKEKDQNSFINEKGELIYYSDFKGKEEIVNGLYIMEVHNNIHNKHYTHIYLMNL